MTLVLVHSFNGDPHAQPYTFLEAAGITPTAWSLGLAYLTMSMSKTLVVNVFLNGMFKESLALITGNDTIVEAGARVATDGTPQTHFTASV